jgi:hypothetical protein
MIRPGSQAAFSRPRQHHLPDRRRRKLAGSGTKTAILVAKIPIAVIRAAAIGGDLAAADHVRFRWNRVDVQISIFSAISMASSTSMPR